jgi:hypothetical protein
VFVESEFELLGVVPTRIKYSGAPLDDHVSVMRVPETLTARLVGALRPDDGGGGCDEPPPPEGDGPVGDADPLSDPPHAIVTTAAIAITSIPTRFILAPSRPV